MEAFILGLANDIHAILVEALATATTMFPIRRLLPTIKAPSPDIYGKKNGPP